MEPGVQTPEETLTEAFRLLSRLGLAAGADTASSRSGGTLRFRLSDPADRRCEIARRPVRHRSRLHRSARLVRSLSAGCRLDRPRSDVRSVRRRRAYSAGLHAASRRPRRRSAAGMDKCESEFEHTCRSSRIWEAPRVTKPYSDEAVGGDRGARPPDRRHLAEAGCSPDQGGEPTFVAVDDPDGAEWNTAALGPTKRLLAAELFHRLRERVCAGRPDALRSGQVVSRRATAALVPRTVSGARMASRSGIRRISTPMKRRITARPASTPSAS